MSQHFQEIHLSRMIMIGKYKNSFSLTFLYSSFTQDTFWIRYWLIQLTLIRSNQASWWSQNVILCNVGAFGTTKVSLKGWNSGSWLQFVKSHFSRGNYSCHCTFGQILSNAIFSRGNQSCHCTFSQGCKLCIFESSYFYRSIQRHIGCCKSQGLISQFRLTVRFLEKGLRAV